MGEYKIRKLDGKFEMGTGPLWTNPLQRDVLMEIAADQPVTLRPHNAEEDGVPICVHCRAKGFLDDVGKCSRCGRRSWVPPTYLVLGDDGVLQHEPQRPGYPPPALVLKAGQSVCLPPEADRAIQQYKCEHRNCSQRPYNCRNEGHRTDWQVCGGHGKDLKCNSYQVAQHPALAAPDPKHATPRSERAAITDNFDDIDEATS